MGNGSSAASCPGLLSLLMGFGPINAGHTMAPASAIGKNSAHVHFHGAGSSSSSCSTCDGKKQDIAGMLRRGAVFSILILLTTIISGFFMMWLHEAKDFSFISVLKFGSIPLIAAIIGYGTNILALWMMFWPIEFVGCLPQLKIGPPLDFYLCGWQGVIPMKAVEMATLSYNMMTEKLIKVEEIFSRIDPGCMHQELSPVMPQIIASVLENAGQQTIPKTWAKLPDWLKSSLIERTSAATGGLLTDFMNDMKGDIDAVFDLRHCCVSRMVNNKVMLNGLFFECGDDEIEFIKVTGFYLGYVFGIVQMIVWLFVRSWWILPVCGILVGYLTNEFALKAIFIPVDPVTLPGGVYTIHGLFLKRQQEVSPIYAKFVTRELLHIDHMIQEMCYGEKHEELSHLVDRHVMKCFKEQIGKFEQFLNWSIGPEDLERFQRAACIQFWKEFPAMMKHCGPYMEEAMMLEATISERMRALPSKDFERLLHSVFEQDEFKLVLVGAILGALVGFLQALVQEPKQLGITFFAW